MRTPPRFDNPYSLPGRWWKVGVHIHTTNSDGHVSPERAVRIYRSLGYDAIAIADHNFITRPDGPRGRPLLIPSAEISGPPDILWLGAHGAGKTPIGGAGLQPTLDRIRSRGGLAVVAHPSWSDLLDRDLMSRRGLIAIEIYNSVAQDLNGRGSSVELWDHLLGRGKRVWGLADDDTHFGEWRGRPGRAWLWVKSPRLAVPDLLRAIRRGAFHGTTGPRILAAEARRGILRLRTSPAARVHFVSAGIGAGSCMVAPKSRPATRWEFDIMRGQLNVTRYARFEVIDSAGRCAWSNPLLVKGGGIRFW